MLHSGDSLPAGDYTAILDCHDLQEAVHDHYMQSMLLSMWDADVLETRTEQLSEIKDKKTRNRLSAQLARAGDKEYVDLMLAELQNLTETFDVYAKYIMQLKVHATDAVQSTVNLEHIYAHNKIVMPEQSDVAASEQELLGMSRKERNRIHAQKSRERKQKFVQDLIQQRDKSWSTLQEVMEYTTALEGACSVLHDFDDTGYVLLQLTETRQRLLMRTGAHKQKFEQLRTRASFRETLKEGSMTPSLPRKKTRPDTLLGKVCTSTRRL